MTGATESSTIKSIGRLLSRVEHSSVIDEQISALQQLAELPLGPLTAQNVAETLIRTLVEIAAADQQRDDEDVCSEILKTLIVLITERHPAPAKGTAAVVGLFPELGAGFRRSCAVGSG